MFPTGMPGLALLILRASVVIAILLDGLSHRSGLSGLMLGALAILCIALSVGFFTPIAGMIALACHALAWSKLGGGAGFETLAVLNALALALIGPGAYSVDALRFGRLLVILPPD